MMFAVSLVATTITFIKRKFMTQLRERELIHTKEVQVHTV